ncbi:MAG: hypothetical protein NTX50_08525 [Candidatus Sumerlaeota bacterium]|nr:hypothetical protein [Candidatus Sumerlaeota bacterium]
MPKTAKGFHGGIRWFLISIFPLLVPFLSTEGAHGMDNEALRLHPENPHYLLFHGKPAVLVGSTEHYGAVMNLDFDYAAYLDAVQAAGLNLTRTFSGAYVETAGAFKIEKNTLGPAAERFICPWARSSEPGYRGANGGNKFDLAKWDEAYFKRLKEFVAQAGKRGIAVEYVLFCPYYENAMWDAAPFNAKNNVNGVGGIARTEALTLKNGALLDVQDAMVRKVAEELKDFGNVYYEICNEPYFGGVTLEWQHHIADTLVAAEKEFPVKHLIAQNIANGKAKIEKPHPAVSIFNFHYATPPDTVGMNYGLNKPIADDETGFKGTGDTHYRKEGWQFILAGGAIYDHLDYSFTVGHEKGDFAFPAKQPGGGGTALRAQFKILKDFICSFDFTRMKPDRAAVSGLPNGVVAYALSEPAKAYAIYLQGGAQADINVELPAGTYKAEWINTKTGKTDKAETFAHGGGRKALTSPPYSEDIALRIIAAAAR